jgi:hypothetical protein
MKKQLLFIVFILLSLHSIAQTGYTCATAKVISALPYQDSYSTCGAGNDISTGTCNNTYANGEDVIYKMTITNAPVTLAISCVGSGTSYPGVTISTSCTFATCVYNGSNSTAVSGTVNITTNGTYYVKVDNWAPPNCFSYTLNIDPPPTNDLICNAIPLTVNGGCISSNNTQATQTAASDISSCISEDKTLWYYFDATDDSMTITSLNSHIYGEMALFSSSNNLCSGTLTQVSCLSQTTASKVEVKLTTFVPGKRYFIMIDGWASYTGSSCVSVIKTPAPPPVFGSSCINARVLFPKTGCGPDAGQTNPKDNMSNILMCNVANGGVPAATCDFTETFLNVSGAEFSNSNNCAGTAKKASWVEFKATATSSVIRNNGTGTNADLCYEVFLGPCTSLTSQGCYTVAKGGTQSFATVVGNTYFIKITAGNSNVSPNQHWLCLTAAAASGANPIDFCASAYNVSDGVSVNGNTAMATQDGNAYLCAGTTSVPNNNVWYKWTTPATWPAGTAAFVHVYNQDCNSADGVQVDVYNSSVNCGNVSTGTPPCVAYTAPQNTETFYASWVPTVGSTYYITIDGSCGTVCSFDFQINNTAVITVPIRLFSFTAKKVAEHVSIEWEVASQINNEKFILERSGDGYNFEIIGTLAGSGTSYLTKNYSFIDSRPLSGTNYYRLKQVDFNGAYSYSKTVSVNIESAKPLVKNLFPNPVENKLSYNVYMASQGNASIEISDLSGRVLYRELKNLNKGDNPLNMDLSFLNNGIYFIRVNQDGFNDFTKFIKTNSF